MTVRPATARLRKHHGLGNDFLVLIDLEGHHPVDAGWARALCDRHRGVGADGVIRATPGPDPQSWSMELRNADGTVAETSGNGLRCLAQALVMSGTGVGPNLVIATAAGPRRARVGPTGPDGGAEVSVGMGRAVLGPEQATESPDRRGRRVDLGNPHLVVLVADPTAVDVGAEGRAEESRVPGGINVEFAAVTAPGVVRIRTWERGAGETEACGSGSCAVAAVLRDWGLVGDAVEVLNPGGRVHVGFEGPDGGDLVLTGPAQFVCEVEVPVP
jgi:diaminopimelate epimerase